MSHGSFHDLHEKDTGMPTTQVQAAVDALISSAEDSSFGAAALKSPPAGGGGGGVRWH